MKILAIIPARGGSKGVPKKNIYPINGKPLLYWTVKTAKTSGQIDKCVVSSDNDEILNVAKKIGAEAIKRPKSLGTDKASAASVVLHVLKYLKAKKKYAPYAIAYLQPTSPLRNKKDLDRALTIFKNSMAQAVISVYEIPNKPLLSFVLDNKRRLTAANPRFAFHNRQDLPKLFCPNGAIYIVKTATFLKYNTLFPKNSIPYIMSAEKSLDIDTPEDINTFKTILNRRKAKK